MPIPVVTVIPGTESPVGEGINKPNRCLVRLADSSARAAIVKELSAKALAAEIFCAHLLQGWGLKTPEVAIVKGFKPALASLDSGYPNLKQRLNFQDSLPGTIKKLLERKGAVLVASFPETPRAIAVDEAIANRDRNFGNILWDGTNVAWIDHERSLGLSNDLDINKLANYVLMSGTDHGKIAAAAAQSAMQLFSDTVADTVKQCEGLEVRGFGVQVSTRLAQLAQKVLERFPAPDDLLNTRA